MLPKHKNVKYVDIGHGNTFGIVDIIGSILHHEEIEADQWFLRKDLLKRQFTIMSDGQTELMSLSILDLYRLQLEFQEIFDAMQEDEREML